MSVNFWCPDAPCEDKPCSWCVKARREGEAVVNIHGREGCCDRFCTGTTSESTGPEVNIGQANARGILGLLGFTYEDGDMYGHCDGGELRQRIFRARNSDRSAALRDYKYLPGGHAGVQVVHAGNVSHVQRMGAATIMCGNTDERTLARLDVLEVLATWAQENGYQISWG